MKLKSIKDKLHIKSYRESVRRKWYKRIATGAALCAMTFTAIEGMSLLSQAADDGKFQIEYGETYVYEWHRVYGDSDLPGNDRHNEGGYPAMFFFGDYSDKYISGDNIWYKDEYSKNMPHWRITNPDISGDIGKNKMFVDNARWYTSATASGDPYLDRGATTFTTKTAKGCPLIDYDGKDGDNSNCKKYKINVMTKDNVWTGIRLTRDGGDMAFKYGYKMGSGDNCESFDIMPSGYGHGIHDGCVYVFVNISGRYDRYLYYKNDGGYVKFSDDGSGWGYDDYMLYVAQPKKYSVITKDWTIRKDYVLNVEDNVILGDGATLTVEEGAVLSVEGTMYYNGTIINKGTIVLQKGASLTPFDPTDSSTNNIICDGGDIVLLSGSRLLAGQNAADKKSVSHIMLKDGANIINFGTFIAGRIYVYMNSKAHIENHGNIFLGYSFLKNPQNLKDKKLLQDTNGERMLEGMGINWGNSVNINYGGALTIDNQNGKGYYRDMMLNSGTADVTLTP